MNNPDDVEFCPSRANIDWSKVQCADVSSIQVTQYAPVKYFQPPPDSEDEIGEEVDNGELRVSDPIRWASR